MTTEEMRTIFATHLAKFRSWRYEQLAERVNAADCLEHVEEIASDGTYFQMEFNVIWDDGKNRNVRVMGDLWAEPQLRLPGIFPIYIANVADSFIMSPEGRFIGENTQTP